MAFPAKLGRVSAQYESGGKGVDFISSGSSWGDPGLDSYGIHQLSGAYSMGAFLRSEFGEKYRPMFKGTKPNTNAFNKKYKLVAKNDPRGFAKAQKDFYATTHYMPVLAHAKKKGFETTDRGVQEALFSMSVQHGGAKKIVTSASEGKFPPNAEAQIRRLFKERTDYVNGLRSLSRKIKRNITQNRYKKEVEDCVALVGFVDAVAPVEPQQEMTRNEFYDLVRKTFTSIPGYVEEFIDEVQARVGVDEIYDQLEREEAVLSDTPTGEIPWFDAANNLIGLKEVPGSRNNPQIMKWASAEAKWIMQYYTKDSIPWCSLFIAHCMRDAGLNVTQKNPLAAKSWLGSDADVFKVEPQLGAIMVFTRKGGGHVGFYVSEDKNFYHILGGNQKDSVNVAKMAKSRFAGARWPNGYEELQKQYAGRIIKKFDGQVSYNET